MEKFPCLRLAYEAAEAGGAKPVALNAADEVAVAAFLQGRIGFEQIPEVIGEVVSETASRQIGIYKDGAGSGCRGSSNWPANELRELRVDGQQRKLSPAQCGSSRTNYIYVWILNCCCSLSA